MKNKLIFILFIFVVACSKNEEYVQKEVINIETVNTEIELYSNKTISDIINNKDITIINSDDILTTDSIGEKKITLKYLYNENKYKKTISYKVVDNTPPTPISVPGILTTKINEDFYPCENIVVADNYDSDVNCEIEGFYDLTNLGSYDVKYIFKDSSSNVKEKKLTINVVDNIVTNQTTPKAKKIYYLEDILNTYKNDNTEIGIDVSRYQGDIDYNSVKNSGISFVIMRLGVQSDIDKDLSVDTFFEQNYRLAKEAGLKVGVYLYTTAINKKDAEQHAEWLLDILDNRELDFPIAFDWENWKKFNNYSLTTHSLSETYRSFKKTLLKHNYDAMIYSSKFYLENIWEEFNDSDTWLAHYTENTDYSGNYYIWQMCNTGRVNGINGDVDIDILYKKS